MNETEKKEMFNETFLKPIIKDYVCMMYAMQGSFDSVKEFECHRQHVIECYTKVFDKLFSSLQDNFKLKNVSDNIRLIIPYGDERDQNGSFIYMNNDDDEKLLSILLSSLPCHKTENCCMFFINGDGFRGNKLVYGYDSVIGKYVYTYSENGDLANIPLRKLETPYFND